MSDFETESVGDGVTRIALSKSERIPQPAGNPNNVFLLEGDAPALINAGHPSQFDRLSRAVHSLGVDIADIGRILYTGWAIDVLGGAKNFPGADHFVRSPDMVRPRNYAAYIDREKRDLRNFAGELREREVFSDVEGDAIDAFLEDYFPPVPSELDFVPVRGGHVVRAADFEFEVVPAPGPGAGHTCLYESNRDWLFTGEFALRGMPRRVADVQSYFVSLERLVELDSGRVFPNRGEPRDRGSWTLQGAHRFINNFMSNAPSAMYEEPTLVEFARRDWGYVPDNFARAVLEMRVYRELLEELVRSRMIDAEGEGLDRKFGTDVEDPRGEIREL